MEDGKKLLKDMEIFATGYHVPAEGPAREWTEADLKEIVRAWDDGRADPVYMKIGHTSDEFCALVAAKLGVPIEIVKGEGPAGGGMISLGQVVALRYSDNRLIADFEVPDAVADLIAKGYTDVSSEILMEPRSDYPLILSAVAVLGAEKPAVEDLKGLEEVAVLSERIPQLVVQFAAADGRLALPIRRPDPMRELEQLEELNRSMADVIKGKKSIQLLRKAWSQLRGKWDTMLGIEQPMSEHQDTEGIEVDIKELVSRLKLQEDATEGEALAKLDQVLGLLSAIAEAMGLGGGEPEGELPEEELMKQKIKELVTKAEATKGAEFSSSQVSVQLKASNARIAVLETDKRRNDYAGVVTKFKAVEGTTEELADELITIEDAMGKEAAERQVKRWGQTQELAEKSGLMASFGTSRQGDGSDHPLVAEMRTWADEHEDGDITKAYAHFQTAKPEEFRSFRAHQRGDE